MTVMKPKIVRITLLRWLMYLATAVAIVFMVMGVRTKMSDHYFKGENERLEKAILADDRTAIVEALDHGASVNARGMHGITPLMLAVDWQKNSAVAVLLGRGADPNLKAEDGNSAVNLAVENYKNAPDIFFAVMRAGGNPNIRRPDDDPVIMRFLNDTNCEYIRYMKSFGADLDITTRGGDPIITDVALATDWDVVWCLIELGAKYDHQRTAHLIPLNESLDDDFPAPDSPIYPYKKKVWEFLRAHGVKVKALRR